MKRDVKKIKDAKIESKDQRWHTRNRITLVFGSNDPEKLETYLYDKNLKVTFQELDFHQAKSKAIEELIDNCIDEYYRGHVSKIFVNLSDDGKKISVEDDGIGFPLDKISAVYTEFRTGSKFKDEEVNEKGFLDRTLGQNGLGAAATCLTSDLFKVTVKHFKSKKQQTIEFIDGALKSKKGPIKPFKGDSGVKIEAVLSNEVYKDNIIDKNLLRKRIIDLAFNNPGLVFYFNEEKFVFKNGLKELIKMIEPNNAQVICEEQFIHSIPLKSGKTGKGQFDISISFSYDKKSSERERIISFVNSTPTYDGGFHHDKIKRNFINHIKDKLDRILKKEKITLTDSDILTGTYFVIGIVMPNPRFESQTKRKLVKDLFLEKCLDEIISININKFLRKNQDFLEIIVDRARSRNRFQELKDAAKQAKKTQTNKIEKLLDANEQKDRSKCSLFICEGDSAIGGLRSARDKLYQGGISLKGKPMNVSQATIKDILNNKEFVDIMGSIGLVLGEKADVSNLRYSKIVFLADSDVDGGHINTLLTNFFFRFWPELFEQNAICMTKAPLYEVITSTEKTYFAENEEELEIIKQNKKIVIKEIQRNKGLGEMSEEAFKCTMSKEPIILTVKNLKGALEMLDVCFGSDTQSRKDLLLSKNRGKHEKK